MTDRDIDEMIWRAKRDARRPYVIAAALIGGGSLFFGLLGLLVGWP